MDAIRWLLRWVVCAGLRWFAFLRPPFWLVDCDKSGRKNTRCSKRVRKASSKTVPTQLTQKRKQRRVVCSLSCFGLCLCRLSLLSQSLAQEMNNDVSIEETSKQANRRAVGWCPHSDPDPQTRMIKSRSPFLFESGKKTKKTLGWMDGTAAATRGCFPTGSFPCDARRRTFTRKRRA